MELTIPSPGSNSIDQRTVIAVRLSATMTNTDLESNQDPRFFTVTGDQTETAYSGTVEAHRFADLTANPSLTIEEYRNIPRPEVTVNSSVGEDGQPVVTNGATELDALVFLLEEGTNFKAGERISVFVSPRIRVRGATMDDATRFEFVVGGETAVAEGDLFVTSTSPASESSAASTSTSVTGRFSQPVDRESAAANTAIVGGQSGGHVVANSACNTAATGTEIPLFLPLGEDIDRNPSGDQNAEEMQEAKPFLPGEVVHVSWTQSIAGTNNATVSPYTMRFQIRPARVLDTASAWTAQDLAMLDFDPIDLIPGDFLPDVAGVEFVAVTASRLYLFAKDPGASTWSIPSERAIVGAVRGFGSDLDRDGQVEIVVVSNGGSEGGLVTTIAIDPQNGSMSLDGEPATFPAGDLLGATSADLDGDGTPELIVSHEPVDYLPPQPAVPELEGVEIPGATGEDEEEDTGPTTRSTGFLSFVRRGETFSGTIDPNNPDSVTATTYTASEERVFGFERSSRVESHDFDGDGRFDLINQNDEGLSLYRNQSTTANPLSFRRIGFVFGPGGAESFVPDAWVVVDLDSDRDLDVLTWVGGRAFFHENRQPASGAVDAASPRGILFETIDPVEIQFPIVVNSQDRIEVSNIDGDPNGTNDIIVFEASGGVSLIFPSHSAGEFSFRRQHLPYGGPGDAVGLADLNGDSGLDIAIASSMSVAAFVTNSDALEVLPSATTGPASYEMARVNDVRGDFAELADVNDGDNTVAVAILGRFDPSILIAGYSLRLSFDSSALNYAGFVRPEFINAVAGVDACPPEGGGSDESCSGRVELDVTFDSNHSRRAPVSENGEPVPVLLGTCVFTKREVTQETQATVTLLDGSDGSSVQDSESCRELAVQVTSEPISELVEPPPSEPTDVFVASCETVEILERGIRARVTWSSPAGVPFSQLRVAIADSEPMFFPFDSGIQEFEIGLGGRLDVRLHALRENDDEQEPGATVPSVDCELISVFQPTVADPCNVTNDGTTIVTWTFDFHEIDDFRVLRNDELLAIVPADSRNYEDRVVNLEGASRYTVVARLGGVSSLSSSCETEDPNPNQTEPPRVIDRSLRDVNGANELTFRWRNGEAYTRLEGRFDFDRLPELPTSPVGVEEGWFELNLDDTSFVLSGDPDRGGVLPGSYTFHIRGFRPDENGIEAASEEVAFDSIEVAVPDVSREELTCIVSAGDLVVRWNDLWRGFDSNLKLTVTHVGVGDEEIEGIYLGDTEYVVSQFGGEALVPVGSYTVTLEVSYGGQSFALQSCTSTFRPSMFVPDAAAGVALSSFEIPVRASALAAPIHGFGFNLDVPDYVSILGSFPVVDGAPSGFQRFRVVSSNAPSYDPTEFQNGVDLIRVQATIPADFSLADRPSEPICVSNAYVEFEPGVEQAVTALPCGELSVSARYVAVESVEVNAGDSSEFIVPIRTTFRAPPGNPDYALRAFNINLQFNPNEIQLVRYDDADQVDTAIWDAEAGTTKGFFISLNENAINTANTTGRTLGGWLGFDLANAGNEGFDAALGPQENAVLVNFVFRSVIPAGSPSVVSEIRFGTEAGDDPTNFIPVEGVLGITDLEAAIDGSVTINSAASGFGIHSVTPNRGALTGGNRVRILGNGFPEQISGIQSVSFITLGGDDLAVDLSTARVVSSQELEVVVPDSGLRAAEFTSTRSARLRVRLADGREDTLLPSIAQINGPYIFESPRFDGPDVTSAHAAGNDLVRISGRGFSVRAEVNFVVREIERDILGEPTGETVERKIPARLLRPNPAADGPDFDGSEIIAQAVGLPDPDDVEPAGLAILEVLNVPDDTIPAGGPMRFTEFEILERAIVSDVLISSVEPSSTTRCGGETIRVSGSGFEESTPVILDGVALEVIERTSTQISFRMPYQPVPDGEDRSADRALVLQVGPATSLIVATAPPAVLRGDVNSDESFTMEDSTFLTQ
ncbi:MAG: FG-GAP-like repeat-containing protein, partial [Planctomycetota bacterium]